MMARKIEQKHQDQSTSVSPNTGSLRLAFTHPNNSCSGTEIITFRYDLIKALINN